MMLKHRVFNFLHEIVFIRRVYMFFGGVGGGCLAAVVKAMISFFSGLLKQLTGQGEGQITFNFCFLYWFFYENGQILRDPPHVNPCKHR